MTVDEFYDGPAWLASSYIKAHRIRRDQANFDAYLQGTYFFEAVSLAMANAFSKKQHEWRKEPYELSVGGDQGSNIRKEDTKSRKEKAGLAYMQSFMAAHNAKRAANGAGDDDT